jgi:hypothetical protein
VLSEGRGERRHPRADCGRHSLCQAQETAHIGQLLKGLAYFLGGFNRKVFELETSQPQGVAIDDARSIISVFCNPVPCRLVPVLSVWMEKKKRTDNSPYVMFHTAPSTRLHVLELAGRYRRGRGPFVSVRYSAVSEDCTHLLPSAQVASRPRPDLHIRGPSVHCQIHSLRRRSNLDLGQVKPIGLNGLGVDGFA